MNNNKWFNSRALAVVCAVFFSLGAVVSVSGQGRYVNVYSRGDVSGFISNLENSSDEFRRDFDREMDNSSLNGTAAERRFNATVRDFENSVDRLRRNFDSGNNWWNSRNQVQNMMANARPVNVMMNSLQFRRRIERQWNNLRRDINKLADTYDLDDLSGRAGNWGGWNPPGQGVRPPNWATGTFYGRNPYDGSRIVLTIGDNGSISANIGGSLSYGTYGRGNMIYIDGASSRVTRIGDGISTTRTDNGERLDYYRNDSGWGDGGGNWGGEVSNPPSWARGTFYGRGPDGSQITLTISNNGRVTAYIGGNMHYGTYYNGAINIDGASARVMQTRNGIRTTRLDNGEVINYRR